MSNNKKASTATKQTPKAKEVNEEVIVETTAEEVVKETKFETGVVDCPSLNVRKAPNGDVITVINEGYELSFTKNKDPEWLNVILNDNTKGCVMAKFIKSV